MQAPKMIQAYGLSVLVMTLVSIAQVVLCGDDGHYPGDAYPAIPSWMVSKSNHQRLRFAPADDDRVASGRGRLSGSVGVYRRYGQMSTVGAQPPFLFPGLSPVNAPSCAEAPSYTYCVVDNQYPTDFMATCIENDPELFKKLRSQVLWTCPTFPDDLLFPTELPVELEEPTTEAPPAAGAEEEVAPFEPEPLQPLRRAGGLPSRKAAQPERARERLVKAPVSKSPVRSRTGSLRSKPTAPIRRARDDTSGLQFLSQQRSLNHTYEVCASVVKTDVGIIRAENDQGEWSPLVQIGDCQQIIRSEECLRVGEPCAYLCSHLKSECTQRFALQRLLTCSAERGLYLDWFRIPVSCGCQVQFSSSHTQFSTTADPLGD